MVILFSFILHIFAITKINDMETVNKYTPRRRQPEHKPKISESGKLQPQSVELEDAVLGALMLEKDQCFFTSRFNASS